MIKIKSYLWKLYGGWVKIHLVDRCLILFMAVLLLQVTYSLFFIQKSDSASDSIDVVMRTAAAGIFGYFLSANFLSEAQVPKQGDSSRAVGFRAEDASGAPDSIRAIGFSRPEETVLNPAHPVSPPPYDEADENPPQNRLQIIIATVIGLYCILILIIVRDFAAFFPALIESHNVMGTVSQLRDFVSGCVGFLIGSPSTRMK